MSDVELLDINSTCEAILSLSANLALAIELGPEEWFSGRDSQGSDEPPLIYRDDYLFYWQPEDLWRVKFEFDAASEGTVRVTCSHTLSNWHEAVLMYYRLLLNDLWEEVLGSDAYREVRHHRDAGEFDEASQLMGSLDVARLAAVGPSLCNVLEGFVFDHRVASAQLDREIARVFQNRSVRQTRSLLVSDPDNEKEELVTLPATPDVRDLCQLLSKNRGRIQDRQMNPIDIARKFTKEPAGNDRKAQNLLRQARRFPHLWKPQKK